MPLVTGEEGASQTGLGGKTPKETHECNRAKVNHRRIQGPSPSHLGGSDQGDHSPAKSEKSYRNILRFSLDELSFHVTLLKRLCKLFPFS
jgi:hypothetical protein